MSSDREVLLAIYRATGGPQWHDNGGWNTDADISSWFGVEVRDGRVVGLDLRRNNLKGPIPQELARLKKTKLTLWGNELTGVLKMSPDREALLALYRATGGPQWSSNEGWNTDDDISLWYGVEVQDGRVVGLYLSRNNLKAALNHCSLQ